MKITGWWKRNHTKGQTTLIRRRETGHFGISVGEQFHGLADEWYSSIVLARTAADAASGCVQPCNCPGWAGPEGKLYTIGEKVGETICPVCSESLIVKEGPAFVAAIRASEDVPHDAEHAGYTLGCASCGSQFHWSFWSIPTTV